MIKSVRDYICQTCGENAVIFNDPDFDSAIIGTSGEHIVYDYGFMIQSLMNQDNMTEEDAIDFIEYNTIRVLDYIDVDYAPIIVNRLPYEVIE